MTFGPGGTIIMNININDIYKCCPMSCISLSVRIITTEVTEYTYKQHHVNSLSIEMSSNIQKMNLAQYIVQHANRCMTQLHHKLSL